MTTNIPVTIDVSLFFNLAGTHASDFVLDGFNLVAATELTSTGGDGGGVYTIEVDTSNLVGFDENILGLIYTQTALTFTVT